MMSLNESDPTRGNKHKRLQDQNYIFQLACLVLFLGYNFDLGLTANL